MPEDHLAALIGSVQPIEESCAGPPNMQVACGGWCKAHSDLRHHLRYLTLSQ